MPIIEVDNLRKVFGKTTAVAGVSFTVNSGEIFGFLGPNGAGKSTSIGMLATILTPTDGDARIAGYSVRHERDAVRRSIGLVFQDPSLDDRLTAEENLRFHARLYDVPRDEYRRREREVLELVELWDRRHDVVRTYSGGMKRRLEIARGLIHYPKVLFLDEPTLGLDPQTRAHLWQYVLRLKREKGMTIFMTTHYMQEAEYCDRIAVIDRGIIVALDTPAALKRQLGGDLIRLRSADRAALREEIAVKFGKTARDDADGSLVVEVEDGKKFLPQLFNELTTRIEAVELREPTLDDVFLSLTGRAIRDTSVESSADRHRRFGSPRGHHA